MDWKINNTQGPAICKKWCQRASLTKTKSPPKFWKKRGGGVEEKHNIIKYKMYSKWQNSSWACVSGVITFVQSSFGTNTATFATFTENSSCARLWTFSSTCLVKYSGLKLNLFPESLCIQEKSFGALSLEMQCQFRNREKNTVFDIPFSETMELLSVCSSYGYELLSVIDLARHSIFYFTAWMFWLWYFAASTVLRISSPRVGWLWSFVANWK